MFSLVSYKLIHIKHTKRVREKIVIVFEVFGMGPSKGKGNLLYCEKLTAV